MSKVEQHITQAVRSWFKQDVESIALSTASDAVRSGAFDPYFEAIIIDRTRSGPDIGLTRVGFIMKMAVEIIDHSRPPISFHRAKGMASAALASFEKDNDGVKFGDPDWDWSGAAARELIHEYEIDHWELFP